MSPIGLQTSMQTVNDFFQEHSFKKPSDSVPLKVIESKECFLANVFSKEQLETPHVTSHKSGVSVALRPRKPTWILKMTVWKRWFLLSMAVFGIYVKFLGCILSNCHNFAASSFMVLKRWLALWRCFEC